jgi:hypothetical protein
MKLIFAGNTPISKAYRGNKRIYPNAIGSFLSTANKMDASVDTHLLQSGYEGLQAYVKNNASVILVPGLSKQGYVYGMDNNTGMPLAFAFARASEATYFDAKLDMVLSEVHVPRLDYANYTTDAKLLIERESTNIIRDSGFELHLNDQKGVGSGYDNIDLDWLDFFRKGGQINKTTTSNYYYKQVSTQDNLASTFSIFGKTLNSHVPIISSSNNAHGVIVGANEPKKVTLSQPLKNGLYRLSTQLNTIASNIRYGIAKYSNQLEESWLATGYQLEYGDTATSYIPTTTSATTRSADQLSYTLDTPCSVYLKTTKQNVVIDKLAGVWNIADDLHNEGILALAIFDRVLTANEKQFVNP